MTSNNLTEPNKCKVASHSDKLIQYFCLDQLCFNKRLFCQACAKLDHKKHRIGRIDRLIEPLSLLTINSFHEDSAQIYSELKKKIDDFYEAIGALKKSFQMTVQQLESTAIFQVKSILSTFSNEKIEEVEALFLSQNPNQEDVKNSIEMINFLQFDFVEDSYTVKNVTDILLSKMISIVQKTTNKISTIFDKLIKNFKENDFINQLKLYQINLENSAKKKMDECVQIKSKIEYENPTEIPQPLNIPLPLERNKFNQQSAKQPHSQNLQNKFVNKYRGFFEQTETRQGNQKQQRKQRNIIL